MNAKEDAAKMQMGQTYSKIYILVTLYSNLVTFIAVKHSCIENIE